MAKRRGKQQARGSQKQRGRDWRTRKPRAYPVTFRLRVVEQVERGASVAEVERIMEAWPSAPVLVSGKS